MSNNDSDSETHSFFSSDDDESYNKISIEDYILTLNKANVELQPHPSLKSLSKKKCMDLYFNTLKKLAEGNKTNDEKIYCYIPFEDYSNYKLDNNGKDLRTLYIKASNHYEILYKAHQWYKNFIEYDDLIFEFNENDDITMKQVIDNILYEQYTGDSLKFEETELPTII